MEPPTCTVLVRLVRTTAAVATWLLSPDDEAVLLLSRPAATATPPATHPADQGTGDGGGEHDLPGGELSHWYPTRGEGSVFRPYEPRCLPAYSCP